MSGSEDGRPTSSPGSGGAPTLTGPGGVSGPAGGGGTPPVLYEHFVGPREYDAWTWWTRPDPALAVGLGHVVTLVNSKLSVYEKAAPHQVLLEEELKAFFGAPTDLFFPRAVFDSGSQRWILVSTDLDKRIYVAVSRTSDPTGLWFKTFFVASQGVDSSRKVWSCNFGLDPRGLYLGCVMRTSSGIVWSTIFAIDKAPLLTDNPGLGTITAWRDMPFEIVQPAVHLTDAGTAYLVSTPTSSAIHVLRVDPPLTNPTLVDLGLVHLSGSWGLPPDAPTLGGPPLDCLDGRLNCAVFRDSRIWTTHCVRSNNLAACRWYELDPVFLTQLQVGTVADPASGANFLNPTLAVSDAGDVVLGGTITSASMYPGAFFTGRLSADPVGEMAPPSVHRPGEGKFDQTGGGSTSPWGIHSATAIDPVDDTLWTFQEYAGASNRWKMDIAHLGYGTPCAVTTYCNPASGSTQNVASIFASSCSLGDPVVVSMTGAPANQFAYLIVGDGANVLSQPPGSVGDLCVVGGSCLGRYAADIAKVAADGTLALDISDTQSGGPAFGLPTCGGNIQAGETWNFQYWHRQPMGAPSTFSEALSVTFQL